MFAVKVKRLFARLKPSRPDDNGRHLLRLASKIPSGQCLRCGSLTLGRPGLRRIDLDAAKGRVFEKTGSRLHWL